jgi:hypothetical protein
MKNTLYIIILIFALLSFAGCNDDTMDYNHPNVDLFVKQLKAGDYKTKSPEGFVEVPHFAEADIPSLLKYTSDLTIIPTFPMPPTTSSVYDSKIRLGECVLWIIESIRLGHSASLGCHIVVANAENYEAVFFLNDSELLDAAKRYKSWWSERSSHHTRTMWTIDTCYDNPLCGSGYRWW